MDRPVWLGRLGGEKTEATERFAGMLDRGYPVGLTGVILQDVVQGISSEREFEQESDSAWAPRPSTTRKTPSRAIRKPRACTSIVVARG